MDRRNFLIGMGAASAGGSILLGSGAFSRVESDRYVTIAVAEDPDAYLGLDACDSVHGDNYVDIDDNGHLYVDIGENPNGGEGVNSNSRTWFDDAFQICNQGKQTAYVYVEADENWPTVDDGEYEGDPRVDFYLGDDDDESIVGAENAQALDVGECECIGIKTNTHGVDATDVDSLLEELDDVVTIVAATEPPTPPEPTAVFDVSDLSPTELSVEAGESFSVSATVTNTGDAAGEGTVELLVDGDAVDGDAVDEQEISMEPDESEMVSFEDVPTDDLAPGEYTFAVATDDDQATGTLTVAAVMEGPFFVEDTEGEYTDVLHVDDGQVGRYMYEYDPSTDDSLHETFKPFLHVWDSEVDAPLTAEPAQETVFDHHRGIFIGWDEIEVDGQHVDNWHTAPTVHQAYDPSLDEFDEEQALTAVNHWLTEPDGDVFVTETRRMEFKEPQTEDGVTIVDASFTLEFETDVELYGDPEHGGIQYRAHADVDDNRSAEYYFSDHWDWGNNPGQGTVDEAFGYDWVAMESEMHGDDYLVVQMNHPDNPVSEQSTVSAYRDYGRFGFYWEDSFEEGDEITVDYRFVIERGGAPEGQAAEINEWYADYTGEEPDPYADSPAVSPEESLGMIEVPDGWTVDLVASEPLVDSPVDIEWDASGRMWVVEMSDYMAIVPGDGRGGNEPGNYGDWGDAEMSLEEMTGWADETSNEAPNGAIKVLEDTDGDGVMDEVTTFAADLTLPRSLSFVDADDGVMIAQAGRNVSDPDLLLCRDTDGDLVCDAREVLLENWVDPSNTEHTSNGLEYMLNNWTYNAYTSDRFQYLDGSFVVEDNGPSRGQWGLKEDTYGRTFHTWNTQLLNGELVPGRGDYLYRGGYGGGSGIDTTIGTHNTVYPVREVLGTNRSYPGGWESYHDDGRLASPTAVSAPEIYRGDVFPEEFVNDAFSPEPKGNCISHIRLNDEDDGLGIEDEHVTYDNEVWGEQDFLASADEVFKPVNIRTGPDGALYVVDMYNGIFQHWFFLTDYLAEYYLENNLHKVPPAGRIYKVYPEDAELEQPPALDELEPAELADQLEHGNGWVRQTAQRLLVQGQQTGAVDALRNVAQESDDPLARMHALWTLQGLDELDAESVFAVLDEEADSHVLANAMQAGEALLGTNDARAYVERLTDLADSDHLRVVVQAAYSLGEVADGQLQDDLARPALRGLLIEYEGNEYVEDAVHSSPEMDIDTTVLYTVEDTEGVHTDVLHVDDGQVGRYMYEYDPSTDDSLHETFKPFLHVWDSEVDAPLTAEPAQETVFDHHRGIFIGWDEIEVDGQHVDNWHEDPTIHQAYDPSLDEFDVEQALTAVNHWLTEEDGDVFVTETRRTEFKEPQTENGVTIVDTSFTLEFETDVELYGDPEHGGIQYRAHADVDDNRSAEYYFSDHWDWGDNPGQGTVDEAFGYDWVAMESEMHGDDYLVVQMNHPDNPVSEQSTVSAYRDYGRFGYYWEDSFEEGDEITVRYRFVIERGGAPEGQAAEINEWYEDYAGESAVDPDDPVPIPYGLNAGGPSADPSATIEVDGVEFEPYNDSVAPHPGVTLVGDHNESGANGVGHEIEGTDADELYQSMMWSEDAFGYEIDVEPGTYDVTLHVAEIFFNVEEGTPDPGPDQERTYSAWVNGEPAFEDLETWDQPLQAMSFTVEEVAVEDGPIVIELESTVENPMINGIDIRESPSAPDDPVPIPYGLNAGGPSADPSATIEVDGVEFEPYNNDIDPHPGVTLVGDHNESGASGNGFEIEGTDADELYQSMMFGEDIGYEIDVEPGTYEVTVHLAEIWWGEAAASGSEPSGEDERIYSAWVQGEQLFEELHVWEAVGELTAHTESIVVDVEDGPLVIETETHSDNSMFSGIEIREADGEDEDEPVETFEFDGRTAGWVGISPEEIDGETNPTLELTEGEMYRIGWTTGDGDTHNIAIRGDGDVVDDLSTGFTDDPDDDQWLTFEATSEMDEYVCEPHAGSMVGDIDVQ